MKTNQIIHGDAVAELAGFADGSFDLTVFSPPYDSLRDYQGYACDLHALGEQLYRVTKDGGVVVMVIQDQTCDGKKTLTSFRTILDWCDSIGFGLFECNIYQKQGKDGAWWSKRFRVDHEYMPIFIKGGKPRHFDKTPVKIPSKHAGKVMHGGANRNKDGITVDSRRMTINPTKCPGTIWDYANGGDKVALKRRHPAAYPDKIPYDFIQVFTRKGDVVLDPMVGSGSTAIAAHLLGRRYVGIDLSAEYCELARARIRAMQSNLVAGFKNTGQAWHAQPKVQARRQTRQGRLSIPECA
ncbi:MAG: site-specific DNA-methyltransferase [Gammaproteobacteria bacterium]|nr:site-specific DNA-methyltransferase [Gammaproteobacteria bacterium]